MLCVALTGFFAQAGIGGDSGAKSGDPKCDGSVCAQKGGLCHDCGCLDGCPNKVCRLKCEPKKVKVTCYKSECDAVCLPPPSCRGCRHCQMVDCDGDKDGDGKCDGKGCSGTHQKKVVWFDWNVDGAGKDGDGCCDGRKGCAKKLMKKEVEVELKGAYEYKWEVVDLCKGCEKKASEKALDVPADSVVPPPPPVSAKVIYGKPVEQVSLSR
jgi:hypothetical protein